ncbi:MAG: SIMPL domain-containing protein [Pirellulales bacterium]
MHMDRFIEVIGEGSFIETASRFIAEVTLEVRAAKDEAALRDVAELCGEALALLRDAGITDEELVEGGTDIRRPWYWKKQVGQNAARKLILKVTDFGRLSRALELLEPLQSRNKERKTISVDMRQPEFSESADKKATALAEAFADAKAKATRLAETMNCRLGSPLQVEEGAHAKRNSGFSGDEDWGGDYSRFAMGGGVVLAAAAGAATEPDLELQRPTRTIYVKCRVKFAIQEA